MDHSETALGIGNLLSARAADLAAHVTIYRAAHKRHVADVVHPRPDEKFGLGRISGREKMHNLFGQMLAVAIEDDDVSGAMFEPITEAGLDRFPFPTVLLVDNDVCARLPR